ncbi:MAG: hypothetical protein ACKO22_11335, partial [Cyanobium sp.]
SMPKALLAGLLLVGGGSLVSAGAVRAAECTFKGSALKCPEPTITLGEKVFSDFHWNVIDPDGGDDIFGTIEFKGNRLGVPGFADDIWTVGVDLNEGDADVVGPASGTFSYLVSIVNPLGAAWRFNTLSHDSDWFSGVSLTTKLVDYEGGTVQLTSANGNPYGPVLIGGKVIHVTDTWSVEKDGVVDSFTNTFTQTPVPGPLPLLGVGAAFGFSRRLRGRIKESRVA